MRAGWQVARAGALVAVLAAGLLAGCTGDPEPAPADPLPPATFSISGAVVDEAYRPLAANVTLDGATTLATDAAGGFLFADVAVGPHTLRAEAPGRLALNASVDPAGVTQGLTLQLLPLPPAGTSATLRFLGRYDCAAEALIISGSCDTALAAANDALEAQGGGRALPEPFNANGTFLLDLPADWRTVVLDLAFDPTAMPGLDGLRMVVRGGGESSELTDYTNYGRFNASAPFSVRIEPGGSYPDGEAPVPGGAQRLQVEVFPHSHLWHPGGAGVLGAGAAQDVRFELVATVFAGLPAPDGYTLLA